MNELDDTESSEVVNEGDPVAISRASANTQWAMQVGVNELERKER